MRLDTVIIGGGLSGLVSGIQLQEKGYRTIIVSRGQNALHFFGGVFDTVFEDERIESLLVRSGVGVHYCPGERLMPLGSFRPTSLSLMDVDVFPDVQEGEEALIVDIEGFRDFFPHLISGGLQRRGIASRIVTVNLPELEKVRLSACEMRSVNVARVLDTVLDRMLEKVSSSLSGESIVILPQVFGLEDDSCLQTVRNALSASVLFIGTLPPSVPGIRTATRLRRYYESLGGIYQLGDEVREVRWDGDRVKSVSTKSFSPDLLEASSFILATGGYLHGGLRSDNSSVREPLFGLDVFYTPSRGDWYSFDFKWEQPFLSFGVETTDGMRALRGGRRVENLFVSGSILGKTRPELGENAGCALRSSIIACDTIISMGL